MKQNKNDSPTRLVYSSDGSHLKLCQKCHEDPCLCKGHLPEVIDINPAQSTLKIKLEKNQRGGKLVTVIFDLPYNPVYFEDLQKKCKAHCGTGGTFKKDGKLSIELQGDQRDKVEAFLKKIGFKTKRAGG